MSDSVQADSRKLSRKTWRKLVKKRQRQKKRQAAARLRDAKLVEEEDEHQSLPSYRAWIEEQEQLDRFALEEEERERERQNQLWLQREREAQESWARDKEKRDRIQKDKEERIRLIQEEWLAGQRREAVEKEAREKLAEEQSRRQETWLKQLNDYLNSDDDLAPFFLPERPPVPADPTRDVCPFFSKTANCRFGELCSRGHEHPAISKILLIPGFYQHYGLNQVYRDEFNSDSHLEYEDSEIYSHFREFYEDVVSELKEMGRLVELKVCCNYQAHLRGHVFAEYATQKDAVRAFLRLHGRWYDGRQLTCRFVNIPSWRAAICGLFSRGKCPKGRLCNYLHVFPNPGGDLVTRSPRKAASDRRDKRVNRRDRWKWSESPPPPPRRPRSSSRSSDRSRKKEKTRSRS